MKKKCIKDPLKIKQGFDGQITIRSKITKAFSFSSRDVIFGWYMLGTRLMIWELRLSNMLLFRPEEAVCIAELEIPVQHSWWCLGLETNIGTAAVCEAGSWEIFLKPQKSPWYYVSLLKGKEMYTPAGSWEADGSKEIGV